MPDRESTAGARAGKSSLRIAAWSSACRGLAGLFVWLKLTEEGDEESLELDQDIVTGLTVRNLRAGPVARAAGSGDSERISTQQPSGR